MSDDGISTAQRWREYALTSGEMGSAATQTVMVVLLPLLVSEYHDSAFWVGLAVGGEGVFALLVPFVVGAASDRLPDRLAHRFGRRGFFLLAAAPVMAAALVLVPFLHGYWSITAVAFVFFAALHAYMTPLWTLLIDAVPDRRRGRVQGARGVFRAAGLAFGLVAAGLLFSLWRPLPFLIGALLLLLATAGTLSVAPRGQDPGNGAAGGDDDSPLAVWRAVRQQPGAKQLLLANALWNGAVDGLRPYFLLFATVVLGLSVATASLTLIALIAGIALGSALVGWLGDHHRRSRVLGAFVVLLTVAMAVGFFARSLLPAGIILFGGGIGAAAIETLPYPMFAAMTRERSAGANTGLFVLSLSFGRVLAPLLVGGAIDLGRRWGVGGEGYPAMWPTVALLSLLSLWALRSAMRQAPEAGAPAHRD